MTRNRSITLLLALAIGLSLAYAQTVDIKSKSNYNAGWGTYKAKLVTLVPDFTPTNNYDDFTKYGTYKYLRTDSTGFFYVKKIDGRWWMVDPDGYAGVNMAVTSFTSANIQDNYDITKRIGFNGTGNFLSSESQTKSGYNMQNYHQFSYTRRLNFFLSYKNVRKNYYETPTGVQGSLNHILVLDPQFAQYCDQICATQVTPYVNERALLGYFTDNEINFNQDQLRNLVKDLPAGDPSRDAALAFAATKGLTEADCINYTSKVTEAIKQEFATILAEHYFKTVSEAIRKYDTNHLILGSRFHGRPRAIESVVNASHKYMDVTSVNFYDSWQPSNAISKSTWTQDHPCIVGEFYVKDINVFNKTQSGAGWYVESQANRGAFYQNSCLDFLANKCYIGWHYFRFEDDSDSNKGIVNAAGVEYVDMTAKMDELNKNVYRLCDHYDGVQRSSTKSTSEVTIGVSEDTYIIAGASNNESFGNATELEVRYHTTESNRREAYLKFVLPDGKQLSQLKHAELTILLTEADQSKRSLFVGGLSDVSWDQHTLSGAKRHTNSDWKNGYNRLAFQKGVLSSGRSGSYSFDVTNWLSDNPSQKVVSFKVFDLLSTASAIKIASGKHETLSYRPTLKLTFYDDSSAITLVPTSSVRVYQTNGGLFLEGITSEVNYTLYTIDGKAVKSSICKPNTPIQLNDLVKGCYLLAIENQTQQEIIKVVL